jgi:serine/threonine protein phosphatase PrpC
MPMMNQNLYNHPPADPVLLATILNEIVGSQASQLVIDELGLAMATHVGLKRDRNEDRIAVARIFAPNTETYTVALVCDGVGGSESGDQAAALAIASIIADLAQHQECTSLNELAVALVKRADDLVRKELQGRGATTLVMLLAKASGNLVCANVGDSRAYSWDLSASKLNQVTIDDTIENELKHLPGNGAALIKARGLQGRLSQAIGESGRTADELRIQTYPKEHFRLGAILGSDGLWRAAKDFEISVANATTPNDAIRRAIALANWVGGVDNSSLIAISDVERLCGAREVQASSGRRKMEINLWMCSTKIKILTSDWISGANSVAPRGKPDKQKVKSKRRADREPDDALQLKIEAIDTNQTRPKIEVTDYEKPKKS